MPKAKLAAGIVVTGGESKVRLVYPKKGTSITLGANTTYNNIEFVPIEGDGRITFTMGNYQLDLVNTSVEKGIAKMTGGGITKGSMVTFKNTAEAGTMTVFGDLSSVQSIKLINTNVNVYGKTNVTNIIQANNNSEVEETVCFTGSGKTTVKNNRLKSVKSNITVAGNITSDTNGDLKLRLVQAVTENKKTIYRDIYGPDNKYYTDKYTKNTGYIVAKAPNAEITDCSYYKASEDTTYYTYKLYKSNIKGKREYICLMYK